MNKKQKIKLIIAVICLIASLAIAILSIGGIVFAATATFEGGDNVSGPLAIVGILTFAVAILATMVVCTFTLSAGALLALIALCLFKNILPTVSDGSRVTIKVLYAISLVLFVAQALAVLAFLLMFAIALIWG